MNRAHLMGVSIPRAGHHFLVAMLERALGGDFAHCEHYTPGDCCRETPCSRPRGRVFYQKNHDFDLTLPTGLSGVTYVVQTRAPLLAVLSDRELLASVEGEDIAADRDEHVLWLARRALYLERFHRKWVLPPLPARILIDYDDLRADALAVLGDLLRRCGVEVPAERLEAGVAAIAGVRISFPDRPRAAGFRPRTLRASRFFDEGLHAAFESLLLDRNPALRQTRRLAEVPYADHPLALAFLAEAARLVGDTAAAQVHARAALDAAPGNRHLALFQIERLADDGRADDAIATALTLARTHPGWPALLRVVSDLYAGALGDLPRARAWAERLTAAAPEDAGAHLHLASLLHRLGEGPVALAETGRALRLDPRDPHVWRIGSELLAAHESWPDAAAAVRRAVQLDPRVAEFHHHLANVLARLGRTDEASAEHRRANELAPRVPSWRWKWGEDLLAGGRDAEALDVVRDALALAPDDPALLGLLARIEARRTGGAG